MGRADEQDRKMVDETNAAYESRYNRLLGVRQNVLTLMNSIQFGEKIRGTNSWLNRSK